MEQTTARSRRRRSAAPIGGLFILLAVIGLVTVLVLCVKLTVKTIDNTAHKEAFEEQILPVLIFDPVPFENPADLDNLVLLRSSLWSVLLGEKRGSFQYDETNSIRVPASDVDVAAAKLFGPDVKLEHTSFGNYELSYTYDEDANMYLVPVAGLSGVYTPRVEKITKKSSDVVELTVGYIPPDTIWTADQKEVAMTTPEQEKLAAQSEGGVKADKYMIYEMTKLKNGGYYISAIRDVEGAGLNAGISVAQPESSQPVSAPAGDASSQEGQEDGSSQEASGEDGSSDQEDESQEDGSSDEESAAGEEAS